MPVRNISLDALRGLAILAMVFSGSIAFGILPAWMYHAQTPPPSHSFRPSLPGISWVDLVFPFFLFSMGAAIPLALKRKANEAVGVTPIVIMAFRRFALLVFFALFTMHARTISHDQVSPMGAWLLQIFAFLLLFVQLYRWPEARQVSIPAIAYVAAVLMLILLQFKGGVAFSFQHSDIIIIVLANMALFGTLLWWFTRRKPWLRLAVLPFIMAVFLAKDTSSWNSTLFNWSPLPWAYRFYYLKYLFIIVPGTIAGDWLVQYAGAPAGSIRGLKKNWLRITTIACAAILLCNVILLFSRQTELNMLITTVSLIALLIYTQRSQAAETHPLLVHFLKAGAGLLLLGLFLEAYEGGIKKDPSTWSYYFVTSGLAFFMMITLTGIQCVAPGQKLAQYLSENGRNPMVAYVAGNLLLLPLLRLTKGITAYHWMLQRPLTGLLAGIAFTGIVSLVTVVFVRKGWLWKT